MYESEANRQVASIEELPKEIVARFAESRRTVTKRSLIPWGEHCTECVWPTCYSTCDLFEARPDGKCRRFLQGMVRIECPESLNGYLLKIEFKRWAKLSSAGTARLVSVSEADRREKSDLLLASCINFIPVHALTTKVGLKRYSWKQRLAQRRSGNGDLPNCMLVECYNPNLDAVAATLTVRSKRSPIPFQSLFIMQPGFNRHRVPVTQITMSVDLSSQFDIELVPNEISNGCTLYFGAIDFVYDADYRPAKDPAQQTSKNSRLCKCVVWDLDNTLWDGILIEDGPDKLRIKPRIAEILKTLDERGILLSVVSKNNYGDAMAVLEAYKIADYFLYPQISWNPKSTGIQKIAASLNIGIDSLLFVDDSAFERAEVKSVSPEVMVLDAIEYDSIPGRPECQVPVTEESKKRRILYREQQIRDGAQKEFQGDYFDFLRNCHLRLTIRAMTEATLERVHELTQRTNQMNFSGNRYSREQLLELLQRDEINTFVLDCEDRFGTYGTIGFCTVNRPQSCMTDLMFSCRIQAKRVEHAFLAHILRRYREYGNGDFFVNYRKTKKNAEPGKVFEDFGFEILDEVDGISHLLYRRSKAIPDDRIVAIVDTTLETLAPNLAKT